MRSINILIAAVLTICLSASAATERFGVTAGVGFNNLSFTNDEYSAKTTTGFCLGVSLEVMLADLGPGELGLDASGLYSNRKVDITYDRKMSIGPQYSEGTKSFLEFPINVKYKFDIPAIGSKVKPFVFTGPGFHIMLNNKPYIYIYYYDSNGERQTDLSPNAPQFNGAWNIDWNVGLGAEVFGHLQVALRYCHDLSKSIHTYGQQGIRDKSGFKTFVIQASYYF